MAAINKTHINNVVQCRIDSLNRTTSATFDYVLPNIDSIDPDKASWVQYVSDLPDLHNTSIPNGQIVYVRTLRVPVVANNKCWIGLDGRVLRNDAHTYEIWAWGCNGGGGLGDGTTTTRLSPVSVIGKTTTWTQVSAGCGTSAIKLDKTLWGWGSGSTIGAGGTYTSSPVSVAGTNWSWISRGIAHSLGTREDGTMWAWGRGNEGQLGDNNSFIRLNPVSVVGGFTDWCRGYAAANHSLGLRRNGSLWTWGSSGRLGIGCFSELSSPVSVIGGFTDWCQISVGVHTFALRNNGTVWWWTTSPTSEGSPFNDWCQIAYAGGSRLGIRTNGEIWGWGANNAGTLGDNTAISKTSPVNVVGGFTDWCHLTIGFAGNVAAVRTNGTLWTWGCNNYGQLGDGTTTNRSSPTQVCGGFTDWYKAYAGKYHTAGIRVR